jgi:hypothetical protein
MVGIDPAHLTPAASLNRMRIVDLPGIALPPAIRGRTVYEFLSAAALAERLRQQGLALGLDGLRNGDTDTILRRFDGCFSADDPHVRALAEAEARRFGQSLGYVILTLRRGDPVNRQARPDWDDSYWQQWAAVTTIHLGGGVVSGRLGPHLVAHASRTVQQAGMNDCVIRLAAHPTLLPLIGAARTVPPASQAALVFDFGQSFVKRACANYRGGTLTGLTLFPPVPIRAITSSIHAVPTATQVRQLGERVAAIMNAIWRLAEADGEHPAPLCCASIASYMRDGQPLPRQGGPYAALHLLSPNLEQWLSQRLTEQRGRPVTVQLIHDGTAAARAQAGTARAAVITLGTALGIGFPPGEQEVRPLAAALVVQ